LPNEIKQYLKKCDRSDNGKILSVIAELTKKDGFECAVRAVEKALCYDALDVDSLKNLHKQLFGNILSLPPMNINGNIPKLNPTKTDLSGYDDVLNRGGAKTC
jgi:hypothetical protein